MSSSVKERILQFIDYKGIKMVTFERNCDLSSGYVTSMRKGFGPEKLNNVLTAYPELNRDWLLFGEGEMLNVTEERKHYIAHKSEHDDGIPLISVDAKADALRGERVVLEDECEYYFVPSFKGADFLITVSGDSMMPKYMSGDMIACKRLPLRDLFFQWNKVYVIDTKQGVLVKRIQEGKDDAHIKLVSDNPMYQPFELPLAEVTAVAIVIGLIRNE